MSLTDERGASSDDALDPGPGPDAAGAPDDAGQPGRRRKLILVAILAGALVALAAVAGWYLVNRKPLTDIPILGIEAVPGYRSSINGVQGVLGVAVTPDGSRIYATEGEGEQVTEVFDDSGHRVGALTPPESEGGSHQPVYIAINPTNGEVAVSDRTTRAVYLYTAEGAYSRRFEPRFVGNNAWQPLALAYDAAGNLYVSDTAGKQVIRVFNPDGVEIRQVGAPGDTSFANGLAVDESGLVAVADSNNGRVVLYGPDGALVGQINRGAGTGELAMPRGIALGSGKRLYVADTINHQVQVYSLADLAQGPRFIGTAGSEGVADGQFEFPNGAATDSRGRVYVTDRVNNRVQIWSD